MQYRRPLCLLVAMLSVTFLSGSRGEPTPPAAAYPTAPGTYESGQWKYDYVVEARGTRSERRIGRLLLRGAEVAGEDAEVRVTPLGRFKYFGPPGTGYNSGWLNTLTYDRRVFADGPTIARPPTAGQQDVDSEKRASLWTALKHVCPEAYRTIDLYAENTALTKVCFRSGSTTLLFDAGDAHVRVVEHAKSVSRINRIGYEERHRSGVFTLWHDGHLELTIHVGTTSRSGENR